MKKLIKDMKDLKNRSLKYMKNFLEGNKKNFDIPANESDGIAYNILIRKDISFMQIMRILTMK